VAVSLADGTASMQVSGAQVLDYGSFANASTGSGGPPVLGTVAFTVVWSGVNRRFQVNNATDGHAGNFMMSSAQIEWTASAGDYSFASAPLNTSSSSFAELGQERNGSFFQQGGR